MKKIPRKKTKLTRGHKSAIISTGEVLIMYGEDKVIRELNKETVIVLDFRDKGWDRVYKIELEDGGKIFYLGEKNVKSIEYI